ncbi:MAG: Wzz/FepE/Etk N-terminal domain-containing protein, partial [Bacteroidota bacterium]
MSPSQRGDEIDLQRIVHKLLRSWKLFGVLAVSGTIIAVLYNWYTDPVYAIKASLLIEESQSTADPTDILFETNPFSSNKGVANEIIILKSFPMIHQTVQSLDLQVGYYEHDLLKTREIYQRAPFTVSTDNKNRSEIPTGTDFHLQLLDGQQFSLEADGELPT